MLAQVAALSGLAAVLLPECIVAMLSVVDPCVHTPEPASSYLNLPMCTRLCGSTSRCRASEPASRTGSLTQAASRAKAHASTCENGGKAYLAELKDS